MEPTDQGPNGDRAQLVNRILDIEERKLEQNQQALHVDAQRDALNVELAKHQNGLLAEDLKDRRRSNRKMLTGLLVVSVLLAIIVAVVLVILALNEQQELATEVLRTLVTLFGGGGIGGVIGYIIGVRRNQSPSPEDA
jgi:hypothetical protein